jgi:hypothetical protein
VLAMSKVIKFLGILLSLCVFFVITSCTGNSSSGVSTLFDNYPQLVSYFDTNDSVSLSQSTIAWETYAYELTDFGTILAGSYDGETKVVEQFDTWVLENQYLKVTLLPDYGGRILSIIYKPTGHEELYQNPVGVPYQIDTGVFYHDWLMVYGGIFPTFPEPEHGKYWFYPWDFEVIKETDQEVVVAMSRVDDVENVFAPPQYRSKATGLKVTYYVRLKAGRAALDTLVVIENPTAEKIKYEYWTNVTLAPGSDPDNPKTTSAAEIIAPVDMIKIPGYWKGIASQEKAQGLIDVYEFKNLRLFENWSDMGIAYAFPDMQGANFWGVINHENQEGLFRVTDNLLTPGMKIWTWGYSQTEMLDPHETAKEARPYIELWAGVTREFWQRTEIAPGQELEILETYSPSVGLEDVTHANTNYLINCMTENASKIICQIFGMNPDQVVSAALLLDGNTFYEVDLVPSTQSGNQFSTALPETANESVLELVIADETNEILFKDTIILDKGND